MDPVRFLGGCSPVGRDVHLGADVELDLIETVTGTCPDGGDPLTSRSTRQQRGVAGGRLTAWGTVQQCRQCRPAHRQYAAACRLVRRRGWAGSTPTRRVGACVKGARSACVVSRR
jgi:hypothetical protein